MGEGGHEGQFNRDPFPLFSAGGYREQFWNEQGCPLFDVVHPAFPLPNTASPTLQGALKDGSGEVVVACYRPEPYESPSLDSCQRRFLWTNTEVDLAPHPVVGLVLQEGDAEKFPFAVDWASHFKPWTLFASHIAANAVVRQSQDSNNPTPTALMYLCPPPNHPHSPATSRYVGTGVHLLTVIGQ